jgi:glutaredoxin
MVGILEAHGADFVIVDVLDEEHNHGLRETLKTYNNWPTFPQLFVGGELVGGCDIVSSMAEKGELSACFRNRAHVLIKFKLQSMAIFTVVPEKFKPLFSTLLQVLGRCSTK